MRIRAEKVEENPVIEERITMEIVVDAYNEAETAMGWYYYLKDRMTFPFQAECTEKRSISPLKLETEITVTGMAHEDECLREMFVEIEYEDDSLSVPLSQVKPLAVDSETQQAIEDWHYWINRGYQFC